MIFLIKREKMTKNKKADIAVNMIMIVLLTIISIFLLMSLFSLKMPVFAKQMYCKTFFYVQSSSFMPAFLRQSQDYCREFSALETSEIKPQTVFIREFPDQSRSKKFDFEAQEEQFFKIMLQKNISAVDFSFSVSGNASYLEFDVCDDGTAEWNLTNMIKDKIFQPEKKLLKPFNDCILKCPSFPCDITVKMKGENGFAIISELAVAYPECLLKEEMLSNIVACWEKANFGAYSKNFLCKSLSFKKCQSEQITEKNMTDLIIEKGLCPIMGNKNYGCGEENNIEWNITTIKPDDIILIEFIKDKKQIKIS